MILSRVIAVEEVSQVGEARRAVSELTSELGFSEEEVGKAAIIVSEAASNLSKHGRNGELILQQLEQGDHPTLQVLAIDKGPGIPCPERAFGDGYSTAGSSGTGLGAIARLSSYFDYYTAPGGTVLLACLNGGAARDHHEQPTRDATEWSAICVPMNGEVVSGDGYCLVDDGRKILVCDGLGHGSEAADASETAIGIFQKHADRHSPVELLQLIHAALHSTRGAAGAVAQLDVQGENLMFAGVGNITGTIVSGDNARHTVSYDGTLGHEAHRFRQFSYPMPRGSMLVFHSDGITARWSTDPYPGLISRHPAVIAAVIYRDFSRRRDDSTILVSRVE